MGYEATTIKAIGFYKYKCAVAPIEDNSSTTSGGDGTKDTETEDPAKEEEEGSIFDDEQDEVTEGSTIH